MLRKGIVVLIVLLALYAVTGFFALPAFLRPKLEEKLSRCGANIERITG